jgi:hypothetical protein
MLARTGWKIGMMKRGKENWQNATFSASRKTSRHSWSWALNQTGATLESSLTEKTPLVNGRRPGVRGQRSEIRGQKSEVRGQKSEVSGQGVGDRGPAGLSWSVVECLGFTGCQRGFGGHAHQVKKSAAP